MRKEQSSKKCRLAAVQKRGISTDTLGFHTKNIRENESDYMIAVLKKRYGKIWGACGAAEILNVPPTTFIPSGLHMYPEHPKGNQLSLKGGFVRAV